MADKFVYALIDPRDETIFYVGQSSRGPYEPEWYITSAHRGSTQRKVKSKLRSLHYLGFLADWCILEETDNLDVAETFWICSLLAAGAKLTNMRFGRYGAKSTRHPDTGKNISKALKGKPNLHARKPEVRPEVLCCTCGKIHKTYLRPEDVGVKKNFFCSGCWKNRRNKQKKIRGKLQKSVVCIDDGRFFDSQGDAAKFYGISNSTVSRSCRFGENITKHGNQKFFKVFRFVKL